MTPKPAEHPRMVLAATILASSLSFIDGSVVNVALPAIGKSLDGSAADLQWAINAYLLPLSALLLLGGAAGDRFGRVRILVGGTVAFAIASAICAVAPTLHVLLAGRALQGIGAAMLLPNSLAILGGHFSGEARGRAVGTWAAVGAMAGALGPVLGGVLIDQVGWRAIFLINLPVALGAVVLALIFVREPKADGPRMPLDIPGAVLATVGLGALVWGLTVGSGPSGWNTEAVAALVVGLILSAAFLLVEHRRGDRAMTPLGLFGSKSFAGLTIFTLLLYGAFGGLMVLLPFVLIEAEGYAATAAGAALLPLPLALAVLSPVMGGLAGKLGARLPLTLGTLIVAAGFLMLMRVGTGGGYATTVLPALLVASLGMAGAVAPLTTAVLTAVDARHTGVASGFNSAVARTGGLVATALLGGVLAAKGAELTAGFRFASAVCAAACVGASLSAILLLPKRQKHQGAAP